MILIWLLVLCLVFGGVSWIVQEFPLPAPFGNITLVALAVVFFIIVLSLVLGDLAPRGGKTIE
jgi:hypothetical protein